jgi:deoxyribodipyrimidine photo-lyase
MSQTSLWWIRRDLRLADNAPLQAAIRTGKVLPVFILDPRLLSKPAPCRQSFLFEGLFTLDRDLRARGSYLILRTGDPLGVLQKLAQETGSRSIFAEEDFTPYACQRDAQIMRELPLTLIGGQTVNHPRHILKNDGKPYTVYTPYSKEWKARLQNIDLIPAPEDIPTPAGIPSEPLPSFSVNPLFPAGEQEALVRLEEFTFQKIHAYGENRDRMDLDGTSALSPYLHFGMLGLRQANYAVRQAIAQKLGPGAEFWLNELIWREFYIQILYHFPHVAKTAFNPALAHIPWRNNLQEFEAWKHGITGVPVVDAAMRQLRETGWMHNRARMIVASFLVKDLLIDWRWGEEWFMENLLDGDIAANNGGWQWTAGTGTDAAPYFRIFNPVLQSIKFDPNGNYIRSWVPELRGLDTKDIHEPWKKGIKIQGYPETPILDRAIVKKRTMEAYALSKGRIG